MKDIASKTDSVDELPANGFNSIVSELENTVTDSGQTLDGSAETDPDPSPVQLSRALTEASQSADFYTDSGAADAYVLTAAGNWRQSTAYRNGQHFRFIPDNANTGASTINISGLGIKTLENVNGTSLNAGQLDPTRVALVYYNSSADRMKLIDPTFGQDSGGAVLSYITNFGAESGTEGWATYADAAGATPIDGTGGSPSVTLTRITGGSQLVGIGSFLFTKDAVNRQGEGFSNDFVIPKGYRNRPQKLSFIFEVATGTYTDGDLGVFLYDVDNSTLITPSINSLSDFSTANLHKATFDLANSTAVNYRLIIHQVSTTTNGYTIRFDQFIVINNEDESDVIGIKNYVANPDGKYGVENITVTSNISVVRETTLANLAEESKGYGITVSASSAATDGTNYAQWDAKYPFDDADKNTAVLQAKVKATGGWKIVAWNTDTDEAASAESEELTEDKPVLLVVFPKVANTIVARLIPTTGSPADINISDVTITPKIASTGTIKTPAKNVSGTLTYSSDYGTLATENVFRFQDADSYEYYGFVTVGTVGGTDNIITLPFSIDTSKLPQVGSTLYVIPDSYIQKQETTGGFNSANYKGYWVVDSDTPNQIYFRFAPDSSTSIGGPIGVSSFVSSGQSFFFKFNVPVSGLSGSTLTATEAQIQNTKGTFQSSVGQTIADSTWTTLQFATPVSDDTLGQWDTSTNTFTADRSGYLEGSFSILWAAAFTNAVDIRCFINGGTEHKKVKLAPFSSAAISNPYSFSDLYLNKGDTVVFQVNHTEGVNRSRDADAAYNWLDLNWQADRSAQTPGFPFTNTGDGTKQNVIVDSWEKTIPLDGSFTAGTAIITRIGKTVTVTLNNMNWTGSLSTVPTSTNFLPTWARSTQSCRPVVFSGTNLIVRADVSTSGTIDVRFSLGDSTATNAQLSSSFSATQFSFSYIVS